MGLFDSVWVPCPQCGTTSEFQSKSGDCVLADYTLDTAPLDVLLNVNRHAPNTCKQCGVVFAVKVRVSASAVLVDPAHAIDKHYGAAIIAAPDGETP